MLRTAPLLLALAAFPAAAAGQGVLNPFFQFGAGFASASSGLGESVAIDRNGDFVAIGSSDGALLYSPSNDAVVELTDPNFQFNGQVDVDNGRTVAGLAGAVAVFGPSGQVLDVIDRPFPSSTFGGAVAIDGDLVAIGDLGLEVNGDPSAGAVFITDLTGLLGPTPIQLGAQQVDTADTLGWSVAVSGERILGGAPNVGFEDPVTDTGAAYVFNALGGVVDLGAGLITEDDLFGWDVAISGDLAIVSALSHSTTGGLGPGAAFVFDLADNGSLVSTLLADGLTVGDNFGRAVAIDDQAGLAVVGAGRPGEPGAAYVFDAFTGDLLYELNNPNSADRDGFGGAVDILGDLIAVGSSGDDTFADGGGSAYFYQVPEPGAALLAILAGKSLAAFYSRRRR